MRTLAELNAIVKAARKAGVATDLTREERDLLTFEDRVLRGYVHRLDGITALRWIEERERELLESRRGVIAGISNGEELLREVQLLRAERTQLMTDIALLRIARSQPGSPEVSPKALHRIQG